MTHGNGYEITPPNAGLPPMNRFLVPILLATAAATLPAAAQTPPTQGWPANRPPQAAPPAAAAPQAATPPAAKPAPGGQQAATGTPPAIPLPSWFAEIDVNKKGEVTRAEFLKYRMKSFEQLDTNKDGKLSVEEFLKVVEPPLSPDVPGKPPIEELRNRARAEFQNLDTNRNGFVERAEAEALVHSEFNNYDTDRDNKITEPEVRLIVQRSMQREASERQQMEARRRAGMATINEIIDMYLKEADKLDKNGDGKVSQLEYLTQIGPADGPEAKNLLPYELRKKIATQRFQEVDTNKDGQLDRIEFTTYAVKKFLEMDLNKDRFVSDEEFKKDQEAEGAKVRAFIQTQQPATPQPRPAPVQPRGGQPAAPQPAPPGAGLAPGLPQGTR